MLSPTRHKLRRAIKILNETFSSLGLEKRPGKTFIGRVERGFDFLGYHLTPGRLTLARATVERFLERAYRLTSIAGEARSFPRLGAYMERFAAWASGDLELRYGNASMQVCPS